MRSSIQVLRGKKIENTMVQSKIEAIHNSWIAIENAPFEDENIEFSVEYDENQYCILGSDWFLIYSIDDTEVFERKSLIIDFFEAMRTSENPFRRSVEMIMAFKMLARNYGRCLIEASVNSYSFPFYELFLRKEFICKYYEEEASDSKYRTMLFYFNSNKLLRTKP